MHLDQPTPQDLAEVVANAWDPQRAEIAAFCGPDETPLQYVARLDAKSVITHALYYNDRPYAVGGMWLEDRHTAGTWLIHTEQALEYYGYIIRAIRSMMKQMAVADIRVFQATTLEHERTQRFYLALGMHKVRDLPGEGVNGETLALYERWGVN